MLSDIDEDGVYRLAAAVVRGVEDPAEVQAWREVGDSIRARLGHRQPQRTNGAARPVGHMDMTWSMGDDRSGKRRTRGRRSGSARISARKRGAA